MKLDAFPGLELPARVREVDQDQIGFLWHCWFAFVTLRPALSSSVQRGVLTLLCAPGGVPRSRAAASRIAGGATLVVLADAVAARQLMRAGACDFVVTSLDEALRILKNEVRRAAPVSVCLVADAPAVLTECVERGLQPDRMDCEELVLEERGARHIVWEQNLADAMLPCSLVQTHGAPAVMRQAISRLASSFPPTDPRVAWLLQGPPVLGRNFQHVWACPATLDEAMVWQRALQTGLADETGGMDSARRTRTGGWITSDAGLALYMGGELIWANTPIA
jgi:hypothetical protein